MIYTIIDGNSSIAEFLGLKEGWWIATIPKEKEKQFCDLDSKTFLGSRAFRKHELIFHSSFEWLMNVVVKIESKKYNNHNFSVTIKDNTCEISINGERLFFRKYDSKIQAVWLAVVDFVKWYSKLK